MFIKLIVQVQLKKKGPGYTAGYVEIYIRNFSYYENIV